MIISSYTSWAVYGPFRTSISTRIDDISLADLFNFLLIEEFHLGKDTIPVDFPLPSAIVLVANVVHHSSSSPHRGGRDQSTDHGHRGGRNRGRSLGHNQFYGKHTNSSSNSSSTGSRPIC